MCQSVPKLSYTREHITPKASPQPPKIAPLIKPPRIHFLGGNEILGGGFGGEVGRVGRVYQGVRSPLDT
ncbi:hypothetical protein [Helicobacter canis]|uniref:hypothetical protein n=1 Tax=Helicobacter canis TaxID=29419 RepID=UPI000E0F88D8|nr:hypothetical protein [Helicobacter canis]